MLRQVFFENRLTTSSIDDNVHFLKQNISQQYGVPFEDLFVTINGKRVPDETIINNDENVIRIHSRLIGGKGGFGSMLRAIGAQIEKTTNREACRDLSGRRLRDINEEKRLRKWLDGQSDREKEAAERKQKKLEKLLAEPKVEVNLKGTAYEKERHELPERVSAAVDAGWQAAGSSGENVLKRKADVNKKLSKKSKLWIDADLSDCSSISDSDDDNKESISRPVTAVSTDSGNDSDRASVTSAKI